MTTKDSILSLVDMIWVEQDTTVWTPRPEVVDQGIFQFWCRSKSSDCILWSVGETLSSSGAFERCYATLWSTPYVTPNHDSSSICISRRLPNGLVVNSQWEDRVRLGIFLESLGLAVASKLDDGNGNVSRVALSISWATQRIRAFETRLAVSSSGPLDMSTQFLLSWNVTFWERKCVRSNGWNVRNW